MRKTIFTCLLAVFVSVGLMAQTDPGTENLTHLYTFNDGTATDLVGGVDGVLEGATVSNGQVSLGAGYVALSGKDIAINTYQEITVEAWFSVDAASNTGFHTLIAFGSSVDFNNNGIGTSYLQIQPMRGDDNVLTAVSCQNTTNPWSTETGVATPESAVSDGNLHHVVSICTDTSVIMYVDNVMIGESKFADVTDYVNAISNISNDTVFFGKSVYIGDPLFTGMLDEVKIYDKALSTDEVAYNFEKGPQLWKVAYVTEDKMMDATATQPDSDPIVKMLMADPMLDVDVFTIAKTDTIDLGAYDVVIAQEPFSSSGDVWKSTGALGMGVLEVPFIHNKVYTMKDGRGFTDGAAGSGGEVAGTFYIKVDPANQANELFNGLTFDGDSVQIFMEGANDDGSLGGTKGLQYAVNVEIKDATGAIKDTKLASGQNDPAEATVCINDLAAGDSIGSEELKVRMIEIANNFGAICANGGTNITNAGLTIWRNAVYSLAGIDVPTEMAKNQYKKIAYVTEIKDMDATATQPGNDPIVQMLKSDDNFVVTVMEVANDSVFSLDGYDVVVAQEPFSSGSDIWKRGGSLGLGNIPVPFIHNKVYTLKDGRGFTDGATGSGGAADSTLYIKVDPANQSNVLFNGITFDGDSVQLLNMGATDAGAAGTKGLQYAVDVEIKNAAGDSISTLLASGQYDPANATVCINDFAAGDSIGSEELMARMITMSHNYGAVCADGGNNLTAAGLTLWRNAIYSLAGLTVSTEAFDNSIDYTLTASAGTVNTTTGAASVTLPSGSTGVDLGVAITRGIVDTISTVSGLSDGAYEQYIVAVKALVGTAADTMDVYVHVQSAEEILYVCRSANGVVAEAEAYDVNVYDALVEAGHSVTAVPNAGIFEWTPDGIMAFDYTPYSGMVIGGGVSSSNANDYAKRNYPIPCVSMQNDGPRSNKWGWVADALRKATKAYDETTAQIKITNVNHPITQKYAVDELIKWSDGTASDEDFLGKEIKSYNLADSISTAVPLATIEADGSLFTTMWAIPAESEVWSMNGDYETYEKVTTASNVVLLYLFNDGLNWATDAYDELLIRSLKWAMGGDFTGIEDAEVSNLDVTTTDGAIIVKVDAPASVNVVSIDGKVVASQTVESVATIAAQPGMYVVTVDGEAVKVIVK